MSVPSAVSQRPAATAAAEPEEEPPGTRSGAALLVGVPSKAFSPRMPSETSSVMVLPTRSAPASSRVCTAQAWRPGTGFALAQSWLPPPVGMPATSNRSFTAKLSPARGPPGRPAMRARGPATKALTGSVMQGLRKRLFVGGRARGARGVRSARPRSPRLAPAYWRWRCAAGRRGPPDGHPPASARPPRAGTSARPRARSCPG